MICDGADKSGRLSPGRSIAFRSRLMVNVKDHLLEQLDIMEGV